MEKLSSYGIPMWSLGREVLAKLSAAISPKRNGIGIWVPSRIAKRVRSLRRGSEAMNNETMNNEE
jgi:hypothetical protein